MRIGIITSEIGPAWGAQRYADELAANLASEHSVIVIANKIQPNSQVGIETNLSFRQIPKVDGVTSLQILADSISTAKQVMRIKREMRVDVLHEADMGKSFCCDVSTVQQVGPAALEASRRYSMPFWADSRRHLLATGLLRQPFVSLWLERMLLGRRRLFITPSKFMMDDMKRYYGVDESKIRVIPYGVNLGRFRPDAKKRRVVRERLGLKDDDWLITFSGWDLARKGLFTVIRALAFVPNAKLLVLGRDRLPPPYLELAGKLGLNQRVMALFTRKTEDYYVASDVSVLPSLYDSFGLVVLEAMACGVPVVTSRFAGAAELLTDGKDAFVLTHPNDYRQLAEVANSLLRNDNLRRSIASEGELTASRYDWSVIAKRTCQVYQEAAGG